MTQPDTPVFAFNGIDGTTGEPFYPPASLAEMDALARGVPTSPQQTAAMIYRRQRAANPLGMVRPGFTRREISSSGWGVVFSQQVDPEVREALEPLIEHRRQQASVLAEHRFREVEYQGESKRTFLSRFGLSPGAADPDRLPYYLLLVGAPEDIPWMFQHQLDVQYAVGRLYFDTAEEYARYAQTVIEAETGRITRPQGLTLFGTRHDHATELMAEHLIAPLRAALSPLCPVETILASEATKERLGRVLGGDETPALLFTAVHGMGFPAGDRQQMDCQGGLLCQDWTGHGPIGQGAYLTGHDVADRARLAGLIAFFYACHGAGTPQYDAYPQRTRACDAASASDAPRLLAPKPFVASLPRRLLGHPAGGALAVIGHVERTWGYSFLWRDVGSQTQVFQDCLKLLLDGYPVGAALEPFTLRLGEIAEDLACVQEAISLGEQVDAQDLVRLWTAHNDARGYTLLGDPAVRLPIRR